MRRPCALVWLFLLLFAPPAQAGQTGGKGKIKLPGTLGRNGGPRGNPVRIELPTQFLSPSTQAPIPSLGDSTAPEVEIPQVRIGKTPAPVASIQSAKPGFLSPGLPPSVISPRPGKTRVLSTSREETVTATPSKEEDSPVLGAGQTQVGRIQFDGAAKPRQSLWQTFKSLLKPEIIPSWSVQPGDQLRLNGTTYRLS